MKTCIHNAIAIIAALVGARLWAASFTLSPQATSRTSTVKNNHTATISDICTVEVPSGMAAQVSMTAIQWSNISCRGTLLATSGGRELNMLGSTVELTERSVVSIKLTVVRDELPKWKGFYDRRGVWHDYYGTELATTYESSLSYAISVKYVRLLPDFTAGITISPEEAAAKDEAVNFILTIRNIGRAAAGRTTTARLFADSRQVTGGDITVGSLAQGATFRSQTYKLSGLSVGLHTLSVTADVGNAVEEASETNNTATIQYRVYERVPYKVRFDPAGGAGSMADASFVAGTSAALPKCAFTRNDYAFAGWSLEKGGEPVLEDRALVKHLAFERNATVTLYAVWRPLEHSVVFDTLGGTVIGTTNRVYSAVAPCASLPFASKSGCDFMGWYTSRSGGVRVTTNTVFKSTCTLYARYEAKASSLHFDPNYGGTGKMEDLLVFSGQDAVLPDCAFSKDDYYFVGWSENMYNGLDGKADYQPGDLYSGGGTLYAAWRPNSITTHHFDSNGGDGTMPDVVVTNGDAFACPPCAFRNGDLKFIKWTETKSGSVCTHKANWGRKLNLADGYHGEVEFVTEENNPWMIVNSTKGEFVRATRSPAGLQSSMHMLAPGPGLYCGRYRARTVNTRYLQAPWQFFDKLHISSAKSSTGIYGTCEWTPFSLGIGGDGLCSFEFNGTDLPDSPHATFDEEAQSKGSFALVDPGFYVQTNYVFGSEAQLSNIVVAADGDWSARSSASWLTHSKPSEDSGVARIGVLKNNSMLPRTATLAISTGVVIEVVQEPGIPSTLISFDPRGGTMPVTNLARFATSPSLAALPNPVREHLHFDGWYSTPTGGIAIADLKVFGETTKAYAMWSPETVAINFDANGGVVKTSSVSREHGEPLGSLPVPTRSGFAFAGWTTMRNGGALVGADTTVGGATTLYARWSGISAANNTWQTKVVPGGVAICGCSLPYGALAIPSALNGKKVVAVADYAFFGRDEITSVSIPSSVTEIGIKAFKGCANMTSVVLPGGLKTLGQAAFQDCKSLTDIDVPKGIDYLWSSTFEGCESLRSVSLPEGITAIGTSSFANCNALAKVNIPSTVKTIKSFAFFSCESLADIKLPETLVTIEQKAFKNCTAMKSIKIPSSVATLGKAAFFNAGLVEVMVPGRVKKVDDYCFQKCAALKEATLEAGVETTGQSVWANDEVLEIVTLPSTLKLLGAYAFFRCRSLKALSGEQYAANIGEKAFKHCASLTELTLSSKVTSIPREMCNYCAALERVEVDGTSAIRSVGLSAFSNCPELGSVAGLDAAALAKVKTGKEWKR